ncbi:MAG: GtrA family protein [Stellaceae bacterium]
MALRQLEIHQKAWRIYCTRELLLFLAFGGTAALANLLTGWLLYGVGFFPSLPYWCATAIATAVGLIVNFSLNYSFNFEFQLRSVFQQFSTFCLISGSGIVLTSAFSEGLLQLFEQHIGSVIYLYGLHIHSKFIANFIAVGLMPIYSFPAHRSISFNVGIRARLQQLRLLMVG